MLLEQGVVNMMSRIPLMTGEVDGPIDVHRQIGVDLDETSILALIPVVAAPGLVRHVFDGEALAQWQLHVCRGARAALLDRRLKHQVELVAWDGEWFAPTAVPFEERPFPGKTRLEPRENGFKMRFRIHR